MSTAPKLQESPLQRYLRDRAMYYRGGNLGRISLTDAGRDLCIPPALVQSNINRLHESGFLSAVKVGGRDGMQVFYRVGV